MVIVYKNGDISFIEEKYNEEDVAFILDELPDTDLGNGPDVSWEIDFDNKTLIPHKIESEVTPDEDVEESLPEPDALQVLMSETKYQTMLLEFMNNMSMK